jgi:hypothetical protein
MVVVPVFAFFLLSRIKCSKAEIMAPEIFRANLMHHKNFEIQVL